MASMGQWQPPLPPGYEARWDPTQRAYFFINHNTKATTWVDPRFSVQPPQQQQQQHHQAAAQSLNQHGQHGQTGGNRQGTAMTTMYKQFGSTTTRESEESSEDEWEDSNFDHLFASSSNDGKVDMLKLQEIRQAFPTAPENVVKELLTLHNNSTVRVTNALFEKGYKREAVQHPPPRRTDMLERLIAMFPTANRDLVSDLLESCDNDEKEARTTLETIGYKASFPETHRNPSATGGRAKSPAKSPAKSKSPSPAKTTQRAHSPAKPKVTEAQKKALVSKFQRSHPTIEKTVIEMALQVCDYDESRTKEVLEGMASSEPSRPSTSTSRTRHRSPSPTPALSPSSLEPVSLFDDPGTRPSTSSTNRARSSTPDRARSGTPGFKHSSDAAASRPSTAHSTRSGTQRQAPKHSTSSTTHTQQHTRAKQVTHQGQRRPVVSRQPQGSSHTSEYRTGAKGPDPSMRVGPNKNLLLSEYVRANGPNREQLIGPDPSRVGGAQGAMGPDSSLHCGPQYHLRQGPDSQCRVGVRV